MPGSEGGQEGGDMKSDPCGTTPTTLPSGLEVSESVLTLMKAGRTAGPDNTDADGATKQEPLSLQETPILRTVSPLAGKTTDRRAGCGRSAGPVRREGASKPIDAPYPYQRASLRLVFARLVAPGVTPGRGRRFPLAMVRLCVRSHRSGH